MKKHFFQNSKGLNLVGVLHDANIKTDKAVIIAHGFTSNKDRPRHVKLANVLANEGIAAFRIDFAGSGDSDEREITIKGQVCDLRGAIEFLKGEGYVKIGVLGESLGGLVALEAFNKEVDAMALWAPITKPGWTVVLSEEQKKSLKDKGYYIYHKETDNKNFKIPQSYINEGNNFKREQLLGNINILVMIVHGIADETIPIKDSEEAVDILPQGSKLEKIENWEHGDHKMDESMDIIVPKTVAWFKKHL